MIIRKIFLSLKRLHFGANELAHLEMVGTIVHQLTDGLCPEEIKAAGLGDYYTDHGVGLESIQKEFKIND